jgi:hypothetical protein
VARDAGIEVDRKRRIRIADPTVNFPMMRLLVLISIIIAMTGTATTPFGTALQ